MMGCPPCRTTPAFPGTRGRVIRWRARGHHAFTDQGARSVVP
ncbi:hypothetical protein LI90_3137 [Carbonactinospora thermoautotrophica]|uniref:Uncharacterized protein n=1 Tax=Carbonactinospora thermoautotrophica TaxID=1469144 RepID=A0A132MW06_9ACTN|nr:hypothetical protein LI90_3137 [Carbonactinospora thermoautotrophica]